MDRIANGTQVASLPTPAPAVGTPGYGTNGDPGAGLLGTVFGADEFNPIQEELMAFLTAAGVAPSRTVHNKVLTSVRALFSPGRLLGVRVFASPGTSTYTPTTGTQFVIVEAVGGGGGGGGAIATSSSGYSTAAGGASGSPGRGRYTSGFSGVTVTVGAGGASVAGGPGGAGGTSSFGGLLTCPGGGGGLCTQSASSPAFQVAGQGLPGAASSGGHYSAAGAPGLVGAILSATFYSGQGGSSIYGGGGTNTGGGLGGNGSAPGAGGGGSANNVSTGATGGGLGAPGVVIVWEYA